MEERLTKKQIARALASAMRLYTPKRLRPDDRDIDALALSIAESRELSSWIVTQAGIGTFADMERVTPIPKREG